MALEAEPYKKKAIPDRVRREVALRYGCPLGGSLNVPCHYCGRPGRIYWHRLHSGRPSAWVSFSHQLDHVYPEVLGGRAIAQNLVLACKSCNCSKGAKV